MTSLSYGHGTNTSSPRRVMENGLARVAGRCPTDGRPSTRPASISGPNLLTGERRMSLYIGTSGYSYKPWKGTFYPEDLPARQMLRYYGERFRTVEINSTFYGMPKASILEGWAGTVPADFQFALKAPR